MGSQVIQENFEKVTEKNKDAVVEKTKTEVINLLRQTIRPEFLNRIDEVIMFQPLMKNDIKGIITIQLNQLKEMLLPQGILLEFTDYSLGYLVENGFDPQFGARPLKRLIQKEIINLLSKKIISGDIRKENPIVVDVFDGVVVLRNE
jgi:ATP-dependent Clp protease ATP-binding subunit ClpB